MNINLRPDNELQVQTIQVGRIKTLVVRPADGEPFYCETLQYVQNLRDAGVEAEVDVYHMNSHAFDMLRPEEETSQRAIRKFEEVVVAQIRSLSQRDRSADSLCTMSHGDRSSDSQSDSPKN